MGYNYYLTVDHTFNQTEDMLFIDIEYNLSTSTFTTVYATNISIEFRATNSLEILTNKTIWFLGGLSKAIPKRNGQTTLEILLPPETNEISLIADIFLTEINAQNNITNDVSFRNWKFASIVPEAPFSTSTEITGIETIRQRGVSWEPIIAFSIALIIIILGIFNFIDRRSRHRPPANTSLEASPREDPKTFLREYRKKLQEGMQKNATKSKLACPSCGTIVGLEDLYCYNCGITLIEVNSTHS